MKRLIPLFLSFLLAGCTVHTEVSLQDRLTENIEKAQNMEVSEASHAKKFYSYYLPRDIGRYESASYGNIFCIDGVRVSMSLNTAAVINQQLYPPLFNDTITTNSNKQTAGLKGQYLDINETAHDFEVGVYDCETSYVVALISDTVVMEATCTALQTGVIAGRMLEIARSVVVNTDAILQYYSNQVPEIKNQEKVELFDVQAPENGRIEELFEDHTKIESIPPVENPD